MIIMKNRMKMKINNKNNKNDREDNRNDGKGNDQNKNDKNGVDGEKLHAEDEKRKETKRKIINVGIKEKTDIKQQETI